MRFYYISTIILLIYITTAIFFKHKFSFDVRDKKFANDQITIVNHVKKHAGPKHFRKAGQERDTTSQTILLIGDSMAYSLMFRLSNYCATNKHTLKTVTWVSASTKWYATYDTLSYYINMFKPTLVLFVIGSNELFVSDALSRDIYVKHILEKFNNIPNLWIGPPNWAEDTGINKVMMQHVGENKFFLSKKLKFERKTGDKAHPSRASASIWMDSIAVWIAHPSRYPIVLNKPELPDPEQVEYIKLNPLR